MTITLHGTNGITTDGITLGSTAIASTGAEINILDGVTATATELNLIDGVTSTTAELNILDGVTSTAAELNILDGVTATTAEINLIDGGATIGTTALADGDGMLINDGGTMRVSTVQTVKTYMTEGVGASTDAGAVGTYGFFYKNVTGSKYFGNTLAGSSLIPTSVEGTSGGSGVTIAGTWRCMGYTVNTAAARKTLWVRIS
jgi:hypothetical protein